MATNSLAARPLLHGVLFVFVIALGWVGGGVTPARAHDPNLARWDISPSGQTVFVTLRTSGSGLYSELRKRDPDANWDAMSPDEYRNRVEALLEQSIDFREDGRRIAVKVVKLHLGHEATATVRIRRRHVRPLEAFTLDLSRTSSRKNQHHLVFVTHDGERERFMLHRSDERGLVLRWSALTPDRHEQK